MLGFCNRRVLLVGDCVMHIPLTFRQIPHLDFLTRTHRRVPENRHSRCGPHIHLHTIRSHRVPTTRVQNFHLVIAGIGTAWQENMGILRVLFKSVWAGPVIDHTLVQTDSIKIHIAALASLRNLKTIQEPRLLDMLHIPDRDVNVERCQTLVFHIARHRLSRMNRNTVENTSLVLTQNLSRFTSTRVERISIRSRTLERLHTYEARVRLLITYPAVCIQERHRTTLKRYSVIKDRRCTIAGGGINSGCYFYYVFASARHP